MPYKTREGIEVKRNLNANDAIMIKFLESQGLGHQGDKASLRILLNIPFYILSGRTIPVDPLHERAVKLVNNALVNNVDYFKSVANQLIERVKEFK